MKIFNLLLALLLLTACTGTSPTPSGGGLRILATTSIVGDVVAQVGGAHVTVRVLLPIGTDPHTFSARPQDAAALADADLVFANGAGLEEFLKPLVESAGAQDKVVEVSTGIHLLTSQDLHEPGDDPHTWMDPNNVITWVQNIQAALSARDPANAADYRANAQAYIQELTNLDDWIRAQVAQVPAAEHLIVADHAVFGYFAAAYGFTPLGTLTASFSSGAAPSAQQLAALEDQIRQYHVKAVFASLSSNQDLARQVAADTGIQVVGYYHASLSAADGPAASYLSMMRYNVMAIVEALK
jgi:ABC-type Zn uptake system ZnuABC Zn-binding protein ZnuA